MQKISFITTVEHNIGDDFVREGIVYLLMQKYRKISVSLIHKHLPVSVRREFNWLYPSGVVKFINQHFSALCPHLSYLLDRLPINKKTDKILYKIDEYDKHIYPFIARVEDANNKIDTLNRNSKKRKVDA